MGIINVTPDSFSDGGRFIDPEAAVAHGLALMEQGADILDIGGESTRPGSDSVTEEEELRRVMPVVENLVSQGAAVSIDTSKSSVGAAALAAGACIVNDVSAGRFDAALPTAAAEHGAGYIAMHMQGNPTNMQAAPKYEDVVAEVCAFVEERAEALGRAGIPREAVAVDPGIGFGKALEHNLALLAHIDRLVDLGMPVVVGCSRKSFIGKIADAEVDERLPGTLAANLWAWARGVQVLRVHDVAEARQAIAVWQAIHAGGQAA
jgi:dihydropteroate synthase